MYVGFELNDYDYLTEPYQYKIDDFRRQAKGCHDNLSRYLVSVFDNKEVIDAQKIANHIFPVHKANVFLSHSHSDEDKAIELAVSLQGKGISVFVDSCVWGFFNNLLDDLNDVYAQPVQTGDRTIYKYRNAMEVAAGAHMMLTGALHTMIKQSEIFIFLNTDKSIPLVAYQKFDRTFSPWIYSELQFSSYVECDIPKRRLLVANELYHMAESTASARSNAVFAFKAFNQHLPKITGKEMRCWYNMCHLASEDLTQGEVAMDAFYDKFKIKEQFDDLRYRLNKYE